MYADEPAEHVSVKLAQIERSSGKILIINYIILLFIINIISFCFAVYSGTRAGSSDSWAEH